MQKCFSKSNFEHLEKGKYTFLFQKFTDSYVQIHSIENSVGKNTLIKEKRIQKVQQKIKKELIIVFLIIEGTY